MPKTFFAPGRVNLIGDHTDYNGGLVFPAALDMGTYLAINEWDNENECHFVSLNSTDEFIIDADMLNQKMEAWVDYPLGVIQEFAQRGFQVKGLDFQYNGDLPIGAALSSSASIEVATAIALNEHFGNPFSTLELVQMAQHAENAFVGMNCGIMDQFASGFGKKNHAIALDCNTLQYEWVPLKMDGLKFVISNTNKKRGLVDSAYNQRRSECQQGLELIQQKIAVDALCQLSMEQFNEVSELLEGAVLQRVRHAVSEHDRVKKAIAALKSKNMELFGQLMNESHASLRDDYEVSCAELNFLVKQAQLSEGVLGSRMTGAGFGGCTVTLMKEDAIEKFISTVGTKYEEQFGHPADFYVAEIGDGASMIKE